tara:strand:- start:723 stop:893 length:171 start_codon:yes stop_codon:yes gene_type:complete
MNSDDWRSPALRELDRKIDSAKDYAKEKGIYAQLPKDREWWVKFVETVEMQCRTNK